AIAAPKSNSGRIGASATIDDPVVTGVLSMSMSGTARASASGLTIAIVLASATFGDHAFAKTKRQPSMPSPAVATATRPMAFSNAEQPPAAAPVRFFTINQVLA